jgi:ubiquinone/menaquinone biosynthesis C-methylase UbiE
MTIIHTSLKPSHYNKEAETYDAFNEQNSPVINTSLETILKQHKAKTILDLTCGTGSQVFWLTEKGFDVVGVDINTKMLNLAKQKANIKNQKIKFIKGDMRNTHVGKFDAAISIFNSIGHLTKTDFIQTLKNIDGNLNNNGLYIFDIFNLSYFLKDDNITKLTIDWQKKHDGMTAREIQYSTISIDGILTSYDIYHQQIGTKKPKISKTLQTLQIYSATELKNILQKNGFKILKQCDVDGSRFYPHKTQRILTLACKQ